MDGWKIIERAIPRACAEAVAHFLRVSPDLVRRWQREPLAGDRHTATGRRSPLDQVLDLVSAVYLVNPEGADLIVEKVRAHLAGLKATHGRADVMSRAEIEESLAQIARNAQAALDSLRAQKD